MPSTLDTSKACTQLPLAWRGSCLPSCKYSMPANGSSWLWPSSWQPGASFSPSTCGLGSLQGLHDLRQGDVCIGLSLHGNATSWLCERKPALLLVPPALLRILSIPFASSSTPQTNKSCTKELWPCCTVVSHYNMTMLCNFMSFVYTLH